MKQNIVHSFFSKLKYCEGVSTSISSHAHTNDENKYEMSTNSPTLCTVIIMILDTVGMKHEKIIFNIKKYYKNWRGKKT